MGVWRVDTQDSLSQAQTRGRGMGNSTQVSGFVKWFNNAKGWGFLALEEDGDDIFVHYSQIDSEGFRTLSPGQEVHFTLCTGPRGQYAEDVTVVVEESTDSTDDARNLEPPT